MSTPYPACRASRKPANAKIARTPDPTERAGSKRTTAVSNKGSPDDDTLMQSFQAGDTHALELLFDRHAPRLRGVLLRLTGDEALAMDLTQITFLSVVRGRTRFVAKSRFVPWLYTIAMNALRDHRRRSHRELLTGDGSMPDPGLPGVEPDPSLERRVQQALQQLPAPQREAVVLHQLEGFAFKEIAAMLGVSQSAIKVRAHRGYARMRQLLEDTWQEVMP